MPAELKTLPLPDLHDATIQNVGLTCRYGSGQLHFATKEGAEKVIVWLEGLHELSVAQYKPEQTKNYVDDVRVESNGRGIRVCIQIRDGGQVAVLADRLSWVQVPQARSREQGFFRRLQRTIQRTS
jgi:hypothetical protein